MEILLLVLFGAIAFILIVSVAQRSEPLVKGNAAPSFSLRDQNGVQHDLPKHGQKLILVFFPRDNTSRCYTEVKDFHQYEQDFEELGWKIVFVAASDLADNQAYATQNNMQLPLLADVKGIVSRLYGSIISFGIYRFAKRTTFLVNERSEIQESFVVSEPNGHVEQVLKILRAS
jgi:thioredoxin-dependent peroxiredoxin